MLLYFKCCNCLDKVRGCNRCFEWLWWQLWLSRKYFEEKGVGLLWCVWVKIGWLVLLRVDCAPWHVRTNVPKEGKVVSCGSSFPRGRVCTKDFWLKFVFKKLWRDVVFYFMIVSMVLNEVGMSVCWWYKLIEIIAPVLVIEIVSLKFCKGEKGKFPVVRSGRVELVLVRPSWKCLKLLEVRYLSERFKVMLIELVYLEVHLWKV